MPALKALFFTITWFRYNYITSACHFFWHLIYFHLQKFWLFAVFSVEICIIRPWDDNADSKMVLDGEFFLTLRQEDNDVEIEMPVNMSAHWYAIQGTWVRAVAPLPSPTFCWFHAVWEAAWWCLNWWGLCCPLLRPQWVSGLWFCFVQL